MTPLFWWYFIVSSLVWKLLTQAFVSSEEVAKMLTPLTRKYRGFTSKPLSCMNLRVSGESSGILLSSSVLLGTLCAMEKGAIFKLGVFPFIFRSTILLLKFPILLHLGVCYKLIWIHPNATWQSFMIVTLIILIFQVTKVGLRDTRKCAQGHTV